MLRTSPTQSAKNLPLSTNGAEVAEINSGTSFITRSAKNLPLDMAEDLKIGSNNDGSDNKMVKKSSLFKKSSSSMQYLIFLHFEKSTWKIEQSSRWANVQRLSFWQVCGIYEFSWYHSKSILKLRSLGTSTFLSDTSSLSLTFWQNSLLQNLYLLTAMSILGPVSKPRLQPSLRMISLSDLSIFLKLLPL